MSLLVLESVEGFVKVKFHFESVSQVSSSLVFAVLALSLFESINVFESLSVRLDNLGQ